MHARCRGFEFGAAGMVLVHRREDMAGDTFAQQIGLRIVACAAGERNPDLIENALSQFEVFRFKNVISGRHRKTLAVLASLITRRLQTTAALGDAESSNAAFCISTSGPYTNLRLSVE